ncbi:MAG: HAD family hydrolase [Sulfitobacter sp.]
MSKYPKKIKGLIFDKDGTLFDFAATWEAWAQAFLMRLCMGNRARATEMGAVIGFDMESAQFARDSVVIAGTSGEVSEILLPFFPDMNAQSLTALLNQESERAPQREAVPLMPLLIDLRARGLRLGVATNDAERPARAHLGSAGVLDMFDFIAGFDSGHGGKPAPGQLLAFAAAMGLAPDQIVMIGDSTHDLRAGRAAGMTTIGVLTGPADTNDLTPLADLVMPDIGHLSEWLDTQ